MAEIRERNMIAVRTHKSVWVALPVFAGLFALLFQYRIISLMGKLGAGVTPIGTKFPLQLDFQSAPQWLLPFYYTVDYVNTIWFTTALGLLIGGAFISLVPALARGDLSGNGARQHLMGVLMGIPNMLCTCCAATTVTGLRKAGAGLLTSLAFFVTAPALNIVVILLAFQLLPFKLALARTLLGVVAAIGVTYAVARLNPHLWEEARQLNVLSRREETAIGLLRSWIGNTWGITKMVIPLLLIGFLLIGVFKTVLPFDTVARYFGEGIWPTLVASLIGTVLMAPTFTEVLWVQEFTRQGMGVGPAVALLITLPTVSFPSLWILGRVFGSYQMAATLGICITALGVIGGLVFSIV